jgi:hypothetical protein
LAWARVRNGFSKLQALHEGHVTLCFAYSLFTLASLAGPLVIGVHAVNTEEQAQFAEVRGRPHDLEFRQSGSWVVRNSSSWELTSMMRTMQWVKIESP